MSKKYTITDGRLVLTIQPAENGWMAVRCPMVPGLNTQAKTVEEAFANAYDAKKLLEDYGLEKQRELTALRRARPRKATVPAKKERTRRSRVGRMAEV